MNTRSCIRIITCAALILLFLSCSGSKLKHNPTGTFEVTEVVVSAETTGRLDAFDVRVGEQMKAGQLCGWIDSTQLHLKKMQLLAAQKAVNAQQPDTIQQIDTFSAQIEQTNNQLAKCLIINPCAGRILEKYAEAKEFVTTGKPLYKIADTRVMFLRVYVQKLQFETIAAGQEVTVHVAHGNGAARSYTGGRVSWISDQAELIPQTIQTENGRQNVVYAVKIEVMNPDGLIRPGTYGDVDFVRRLITN